MNRGMLSPASARRCRAAARQWFFAALAVTAFAACGGAGSEPSGAAGIALTMSGPPSLAVGQQLTLYADVRDGRGNRIPGFSSVTWTSSTPAVASVTRVDTTGIVTALAAGQTTVRASVAQNVVAEVSVTVGSQPVIGVTPTAVVFTAPRNGAAAPQTATVSNIGGGTLTGLAASSSAAWLAVSFVDGVTTASPTATLRMQPSLAGLGEGTHATTVTISSTMTAVAARTIGVTLTVMPTAVAFKIAAMSTPFQTSSAGTTVAEAPAVIVRSVDDTPVPGVSVTFSVAGGGSITPSGPVTTDVNGVAALSSWTLGPIADASQTVTASAPGLAGSPVTFTALALAPTKIVKVSGDNQSAVLGRPLDERVVVRVLDASARAVGNATVTFVANDGGSVLHPILKTNAAGEASTTWILARTLGPQTLTASLVGPPGVNVTFNATATGATTITKIAGDNQAAPAGGELPVPLRVRVTGASGAPVIGASVAFTPGPNDGTVSESPVVTDASGEATTRWRLPNSTGTKTLTASVGTISTTFTANAGDPPPSGLVVVDGNDQIGRIGTALAKPVIIRAVTTIGSPVAGAAVTVTPAVGPGSSFSPVSGTTDSNGEFRTTWTLGSTLGTYTATVASPGLGSITIRATAASPGAGFGMFSGSVAKVPGGAVPAAGDQAVVTYSGPASGEVAVAPDGGFVTPQLPPGVYTLSAVSKSGAFPSSVRYNQAAVDGQLTSVSFAVAFPGSGPLRVGFHACPLVGDANGTATVSLYLGVNGDAAGNAPMRSWTQPSAEVHQENGVPYGIYTLVISSRHVSDPSKVCAVHRGELVHSHTQTGQATEVTFLTLSNP